MGAIFIVFHGALGVFFAQEDFRGSPSQDTCSPSRRTLALEFPYKCELIEDLKEQPCRMVWIWSSSFESAWRFRIGSCVEAVKRLRPRTRSIPRRISGPRSTMELVCAPWVRESRLAPAQLLGRQMVKR